MCFYLRLCRLKRIPMKILNLLLLKKCLYSIILLSTIFLDKVSGQILVMETGNVSISNVISSVSLNNNFTNPVVIATVPSYNGSDQVTIRLKNITGTGFDIFIEEPDGLDGTHTTETVHYIVIEKGMYTFPDGTMLEAGTLSSANLNFQTVSLLQNYNVTPCIFTQVQTNNSSIRFLKTRQKNSTTSSFQTKLERSELKKATLFGGINETIGYFAISKGGGSLGGVTVEANSFSCDEVVVDRNFTGSFSDGNHFIASIATFSGGDPAGLRWTNLSNTKVKIFVEEDESLDAETNHIFESIDYFNINDNSGNGIFLPSPLPIRLLNFDAFVDEDAVVQLNWKTAAEINNDYFIVERSIDGENWKEVLTRSGAGNSSTIIDYNGEDENPYIGIAYYRLKQVDFDGEYTYSKIKVIKLDNDQLSSVAVYPNPFSNQITIKGSNMEMEEYHLYNLLGNDVTNQIRIIQSTDRSIVLDVSSLPLGAYLVKTKTKLSKVFKK